MVRLLQGRGHRAPAAIWPVAGPGDRALTAGVYIYLYLH